MSVLWSEETNAYCFSLESFFFFFFFFRFFSFFPVYFLIFSLLFVIIYIYCTPPPAVNGFGAPLSTQPAVDWDEAFDDIPTKIDKYKDDPAALFRDYGYCIIRGDQYAEMKSATDQLHEYLVKNEREWKACYRNLFRPGVGEISGKVCQIDMRKDLKGGTVYIKRCLKMQIQGVRITCCRRYCHLMTMLVSFRQNTD